MINIFRSLSFILLIAPCNLIWGQSFPSSWPSTQEIQIGKEGLIKLELPFETLDQSHPSFKDIRVLDPKGGEIPYFLFIPQPQPGKSHPNKGLSSFVEKKKTRVIVIYERNEPFDAIIINSPAKNYIKAVTVEAATGKKSWKVLAKNQPIFRLKDGSENNQIDLPRGTWKRLRLSLDDNRSLPIPVTAVTIYTAKKKLTDLNQIDLKITDQQHDEHQSTLFLQLPYRNLTIDHLEFHVENQIFTRTLKLSSKSAVNGVIQEETIAKGTIVRAPLEGTKTIDERTLEINKKIKNRDLILTIQNGDSPPLPIKKIVAHVVPTSIVFEAHSTQPHHLLFGNRVTEKPNYDLAQLKSKVQRSSFIKAQWGPLQKNPSYEPPEILPSLSGEGGLLDTSEWKYRKPVHLKSDGIHHLEMDLDVLAHMQRSGGDLRLLVDGKQIPYIIENRFHHREIQLQANLKEQEKNPTQTHWELPLPQKNIPINKIQCEVLDPVFNRQVTLYEEVEDKRGSLHRRRLATTNWRRDLNSNRTLFSLSFSYPPQTEKLILVIENNDNPPLQVKNFEAAYWPPRLIFKQSKKENVFLYFGQRKAKRPLYDIRMVSQELLSADRQEATLGALETLKSAMWWDVKAPKGVFNILFWAFLVLIVIALLVMIAKLLPAPNSDPEESSDE